MLLGLNMSKMPNEGFSRAVTEKMKYLIKIPPAKEQDEKKWGDEVPGHHQVNAAIQRHTAMRRQYHKSRCLP
jgi:hypothetical protein